MEGLGIRAGAQAGALLGDGELALRLRGADQGTVAGGEEVPGGREALPPRPRRQGEAHVFQGSDYSVGDLGICLHHRLRYARLTQRLASELTHC